jgi:mannose-6-phosphate isomerase-like protein (cupin superfamily)
MVTAVELPSEPDAVAPDGSSIRLLAAGERGSMCHAELPAGAVTRPVQHRTVEEVWYVVSGSGQLALGEHVVELRRGASVLIPTGTAFQFRAGYGGLGIVITTMPPWPGPDEAAPAAGPWTATV